MHLRKKKTLMDKAGDLADSALASIESALETAKPYLDSAKESAAPLLAEGKDLALGKAAEKATVGKEKAAAFTSAAAALAAEKAASGRELAAERAAAGRDLAAARIAGVKGQPEPKGGKLKRLLLLLGLAGLGALVFKKLRSDSTHDNWQSSYVPTPPPAPAASVDDTPIGTQAAAAATGAAEGITAVSDDPGGAGFDESAADEAVEPHEATTPDHPAEVVDVDKATDTTTGEPTA